MSVLKRALSAEADSGTQADAASKRLDIAAKIFCLTFKFQTSLLMLFKISRMLADFLSIQACRDGG